MRFLRVALKPRPAPQSVVGAWGGRECNNCKLSKEYESTLVSKTVFSTEPGPPRAIILIQISSKC